MKAVILILLIGFGISLFISCEEPTDPDKVQDDIPKILFMREQGLSDRATYDIWVMDIDGDRQTNLTNKVGSNGNPQFSPDEAKIIFTSVRNNNGKAIYMMDIDGSNQIQITETGWPNNPRFSPDGKRIVYWSNPNGKPDICIIDTDGTNLINLTEDDEWNEDPSFSPDGTQVVFVSRRDGNDEIYLMNEDGKNLTRLTFTVQPIGTRHLKDFPQFSPDGSKIVFESFQYEDENNEFFLVDVNGDSLINLTNHLAYDFNAQFSPDGLKIIFSSNRDDRYDIFLMNLDGNNKTNITNNNLGGDVYPQFSPDGSKIAFSSNRDGSTQIYIMDVDGKNQTRLTNNLYSDIDPQFQPQP